MGSGSGRRRGVPFALGSAVLLGTTPVFGKLTIMAGLPGLTVVAARTAGAASLLFLVILLFNRRNLYIFPVGLLGCLIAGGINGLGSLLYYSALERLDAGLGQLLYMVYPVVVALVLYLDGQRPTRLTVLRLAISLPAIFLLTQARAQHIDLGGVGLMLGAGMLYGLHIPINQRVLYEAPAPTVTLYTLLPMTAVTLAAHLALAPPVQRVPPEAIPPLLALTVVTFLSRLALFAGVKSIGGMQTALLGLAELLVAVFLAQLWLGESLSPLQWIGAACLTLAIALVGRERGRDFLRWRRGWLYWLRRPAPPPAPAQSGLQETSNPHDTP